MKASHTRTASTIRFEADGRVTVALSTGLLRTATILLLLLGMIGAARPTVVASGLAQQDGPNAEDVVKGEDAISLGLAPDGQDEAEPLATGGGAPTEGYYRYIDSDEPANPPGIIPPEVDFVDIRFSGTLVNPSGVVTTTVPLGDDQCSDPIALNENEDPPFVFTYFDADYTAISVCSNGNLALTGPPAPPNTSPGNACYGGPSGRNVINGFWDDLNPNAFGQIRYDVRGFYPNRRFIVQWEQVSHYIDNAETYIFQIQLLERSDDIIVQYYDVENGAPDGITFSPGGQLFAASSAGHKILRYADAQNFTANHVRARQDGLLEPSYLVYGDGTHGGPGDLDGDGTDDLFVSSFATDEILVFSGAVGTGALNDGFLLSKLVSAVPDGPDGPRGITFGPDRSGDGQPDLYVASYNGNAIKVYEGTGGAALPDFVAPGAGGLSGPDDLLFFGPYLYVSSHGSNQVKRYDAASGAFVDDVVTGIAGPRGLAFGPDGNLYVASEDDNAVRRYLGTTGILLDTPIDVADGLAQPRAIRFGPDTDFDGEVDLYVASLGSDQVRAYPVEMRPFASGLTTPRHAVFAPDGTLCVADYGADAVRRYNAAGALVGSCAIGGGLDGPWGLLVQGGLLYVSDHDDDQVLRYDATTGAFVDEFVTDYLPFPPDETGGLDGPTGLAFVGGELLVASRNTNQVKRYSGTTGDFLGDRISGSGLNQPADLLVLGATLLVANFGSDEVLSYVAASGAPNGALVTAGLGGLNGPSALALLPSASALIVASELGDEVLVYGGATVALLGRFATAGSGGLDGPSGLALGADGRLYVSGSLSNAVHRFDAGPPRIISTGGPRSRGAEASVSLEGFGPTQGVLNYSCNQTNRLKNDHAVQFIAPPPPGADLEVVFKQADDTMPCENQVLRYTIKVQNNGRYGAASVSLTDVLPPGLTFEAAPAPVASKGSFNGVTGLWTLGTLANGEMATLEFSARVGLGTARTLGKFREEFVIADGAPKSLDPPYAAPYGRLLKPVDIVRYGSHYLVSSKGSDEILRYDVTTGDFAGVLVPRLTDAQCDAVPDSCILGPTGMAIKDDVLYVASAVEHRVLRFDAATGTPFGEFVGQDPNYPFPQGIVTPQGLLFDDAGDYLFVASNGNNQVRRYDATTGAFAGVAAGNYNDPDTDIGDAFPNSPLIKPHGLAFGPDRSGDGEDDLYVVGTGNAAVLVYDAASMIPSASAYGIYDGPFIGPTDGLASPQDLVFSPDRRQVFISNAGTSSVSVHSGLFGGPGGPYVEENANGLLQPDGILLSAPDEPNREIVVVSNGTHQVLRYQSRVSGNPEGTAVEIEEKTILLTTYQRAKARAVASGPDGQIYYGTDDRFEEVNSGVDDLVVHRYDPTSQSSTGEFLMPTDIIPSRVCGLNLFGINSIDDLVVSADGERVFVALRTSCGRSALIAIGGPTSDDPGTIVASWDTSGIIGGLTLAPDGVTPYASVVSTVNGASFIYELDPETGSPGAIFASGGALYNIYGLAFGPNGNLYLSSASSGQILEYEPGGSLVGLFATQAGVYDIDFGADANLYLTTGSLIRVLNGETGAFLYNAVSSPGSSLKRFTFADDGDIFVADDAGERILRFDGHANPTGPNDGVLAEVSDAGLNCARYLTFGPDGNLYVASEYTDSIKRYNGTTGAYLGEFVPRGSGGLDGPRDLVFGKDGLLYVASYNNDKVLRYNGTTGAPVGPIPWVPNIFTDLFGIGEDLEGPEGLAFGPDDGFLYVASRRSGEILRYFDAPLFGGYPWPTAFVSIGSSPSLSDPRGITFGPDGHLYVATPTGVYRYDGETGEFDVDFTQGGNVASAGDLTFGPDGNLYVVTSGNNQVLVFQGPKVLTPGNPGDLLGEFLLHDDDDPTPVEPTGLVFGPDGDLYLASCGSHDVLRYGGFLTNTATITGVSSPSANPSDPDLSNNVGQAGLVVLGADLSVTKTVDDSTPYEGDIVTFTVVVANAGPKDGIDVVATDLLPAPLEYVGHTASTGTYDDGTGRWVIGALPIDQSETLEIQARVRDGVAEANPVVINTVTVEDENLSIGDPEDDNNQASASVFLLFADLAVDKTVSAGALSGVESVEVAEGESFTFSIVVENLQGFRVDDIVLRDRLPAGLIYVGHSVTQGSYTPLSGIWQVGSLDSPTDASDPALATSATLEIVASALPGTGGRTFTNTALITGASLPDPCTAAECEAPNTDNNVDDAQVVVQGADLEITKEVSPGPWEVGVPFDFTLQVRNLGPKDAVNVIAIDRLPVGLIYQSHSSPSGNNDYDPASGQWRLGDLPADPGAVKTLVITVLLAPSARGETLINVATVGSDSGDALLENNRDQAVVSAPDVDLQLAVRSRPAPNIPGPPVLEGEPGQDEAGEGLDADLGAYGQPAIAGHGLIYDFLVTNAGGSPATNVVLTATLPVQVAYVADDNVPACATAPVGTRTQLTCQLGTIAPGETVTVVVQTEVHPDAFYDRRVAGDPVTLTLDAGVTADELDAYPRDNFTYHETIVNDLADLRIQKVSKPDSRVGAGELFTYTLVVENLGPSSAHSVALTDTMLASGVFTLVDVLEDPARNDACSTLPAPAPLSGQLLACRLSERLEPVGSGLGSGRWTLQVVVTASEAQDVDNEVRVYSRDAETGIVGTPDPDLRNNLAADRITVGDQSNLRLGLVASGRVHDPNACGQVADTPDRVTAGDALTYVLTVLNQPAALGVPGGSLATNVVLEHRLPAGLEVLSVSGTGGASCQSGTPGRAAEPARCTYPQLAVGASETMTVRVLVTPDYVGRSDANLLASSASARSDNVDPDEADNRVAHVAGVTEVADLRVAKLDAPDPAVAGRALSYEIVLANAGPSEARNVLLRDALPPQLDFVSARIEQQAGREACTYDAGAHEVVCSHLDVPVGEPPAGQRRVFIDLTVQPDAAAAPITNRVTVATEQTPDCDPSNNTAIDQITAIGTEADLAVRKTVEPVKIFAGRQMKYSVWVDNLGPSDAQDVIVYDVLPDAVEYEIDTNDPMCTQPEGLLGYRALLAGTSPAMATATLVADTNTGVLHYAVTFGDLSGVTSVVLRGGPGGPILASLPVTPPGGPAEPTTGRLSDPALLAALQAGGVVVEAVAPGETIAGPALPTVNAPLSCPVGYLAAGETHHFEIWARVRPETRTGTTIANVAMVESATSLGDPDLTNNVSTAKNLVLAQADLKVTKFGKNDGTVRAGEVLTYTVVVDNLGPSWAEDVSVKDVLQAAGSFDLIDITSDRDAVCVTLAGGATVTTTLAASAWPPTDPPPPFGVLPPTGIEDIDQRLEADCRLTEGDDPATPDFNESQLAVLAADGPPNSGRWILTMRVRAQQAMDIDNVADVVAFSEDPNPANDHAEVEHAITDVADLSIVKTALGELQVDGQPGLIYDPTAPATALPEAPSYSGSAALVTAGRRIRYTLRVENAGPSDAENVIVRDRLPAGVTLLPGSVVVDKDGLGPLPAGSCQTGTPGAPDDLLVCGIGDLGTLGTSGATITFDVLVPGGVPAGAVIENDAEVASDVFDPRNRDNHAYVQTAVRSAADLAVSKDAVGENVTGYDPVLSRFAVEDLDDAVTAGLVLRYQIAVQNGGPSASRNVTVADRLPEGLTLIGVDGASCRPSEVQANQLYCTLGDLAAGERRTFDVYARVDPAIPDGTVLSNCVEALHAASTPPGQLPLPAGVPPILSLTPDPNPVDNRACNDTAVNAVADVGGPGQPDGPGGDDFIRKVDIPAEPRLDTRFEPDWAIAGTEHRYLIELGNAGPSTARDVTVVDRLDFKQLGIPGETFVRCEPADPDDAVTCVYDAASHSVRLERLLDHGEPIFEGGTGTLQPGLPYRFYLVTFVDPGYVLDADDAMPTAENSEPGLIARDTVRIATSTTDFRSENDVDTERTRIVAEADLALEKTDIFGDPITDPDSYFLTCDPVVPGGMITYDLRVENLGPSDAAEVFVVDWLPADVVAVDPAQVAVTVSAGEVVEVRDDGRITIRLGQDPNNAGAPELGRLNVGGAETIRIEVMVRQDAECGGLARNQARVETRRNDAAWPPAVTGPPQGAGGVSPTAPRTPTHDPNGANDVATEETTIECPSIEVVKTVSFDGQCPGRDVTLINEPGQPVTFCYEITNTGTTYLDQIVVTDTLKTRRSMPTVIFTDTITFGADPKLPIAPGETVERQVTIPQLTRECGNVTDTVEVTANPVNSGRTDLACLPMVGDSDTRNIEVPCLGVDFRLQLPLVASEECQGWLQVQNVGDQETIALIVAWGEPGSCPPQAAGPLKAECSGLLRPGSAWTFLGAQLPIGARSAVAYSLSARIVEEEVGQRIPFGLLVCDEVFRIAGSHSEWLIFDSAYRQRGTWQGFDFGAYPGEPIAVSVNRSCPDPVSPGAQVNAAYIGISSDMEGAYDPRFGGYTYYAPLVFAGRAGLDSTISVQNSGVLCTSLEIWFKGQDNCMRPILGDVLSLAPGETVSFDPNSVVGPDWLGSAWVRGTQPLGIVVDTFGANHFTSYVAVPGDVADLDFSLGDQVNYAPLIYSEHQGWDTVLQVQNLSATLPAKVKVYFHDRSGDVVTTLVDWICPRGSQTFFSPVVADLPGSWVGSARVESQDWWTSGTNPQDAPRIQSVVLLERWSDPARTTRREALAYNAHTETIYDWQVGSRKGGVTDGSAVFAVPLLAKGNRGVNSEIGITNLVPKPGFTDFAIFLYDQNGLLDFVCEKLHDRQVEYIDLNTWGLVPPNFLGSMVVSAVYWEHPVFDGQGRFQRNLVGLSAVAVERIGATNGSDDLPGDESKGFEAFPLFDFFLNERRPSCPGVP